MKRILIKASRLAAVSTAGFGLVAVGVVALFTPGPGILLVVAGLAVLAREYRWARRLRDGLVERVGDLRTRAPARRPTTRIGGSRDDGPALDVPHDNADRDDVSAA
jgi:hypothetical protein